MRKKNFIARLQIKVSITFILVFTISNAFTQNRSDNWHLKINYASLKPFIENDLWYVTNEDYHIHPRTEDYTPGLSFSAEYEVLNRFSTELMVLYGRPKAVLGIVDQNSSREPLFEKGYNFLTVLLCPNVTLIGSDRSKFYLSPVCGWGFTSEVSIIPAFGPEVTWNKMNKIIYGAKTGFNIKIKNERLFFNTELFYLSLKAKITENQTNQELDKTFGPFGILLGFNFSL
ncbi:hypothetical protein ACFLQ9_00345 [Bacteroidota bacterium]